MHSSVRPRRQARGLTLVESLVAVGITAVVVGLAVPGLAELRDRQRLRGIAALLETDIHQARSWAVARGRSVRLDFAGAGCWVLHTGPAGDCRCDGAGGAVCGSGKPWRVAEHGDVGVSVVSNSASITFDPVRGTVTPTATMRVRVADDEIHTVVNLMGRVRQCTPSGLPGLPAC